MPDECKKMTFPIGPQPERHDTSIGLLAHFQNLFASAWQSHGDQHSLEDKALTLALARVADNQAAVDKALALAVNHVDQNHQTLRDLLAGQITALTKVVEANEHASHQAVAQSALAMEHLTIAQHEAMQRREDEHWDSHLRAHAITTDAHRAEHELVQLAVEKAEAAVNLRLEALNGAHARSTDERATYATRDQVEDRTGALGARVNSLEARARNTDFVTRDMLDSRLTLVGEAASQRSQTNETRIAGLERSQNIAIGVLGLGMFVIPLLLHFLPGTGS
jgi:hypothetical protein